MLSCTSVPGTAAPEVACCRLAPFHRSRSIRSRRYPSDITDAQWTELDPLLPEVLDDLRDRVRLREGRSAQPTAGIIDSQSVRAAETVAQSSRGYDAHTVRASPPRTGPPVGFPFVIIPFIAVSLMVLAVGAVLLCRPVDRAGRLVAVPVAVSLAVLANLHDLEGAVPAVLRVAVLAGSGAQAILAVASLVFGAIRGHRWRRRR